MSDAGDSPVILLSPNISIAMHVLKENEIFKSSQILTLEDVG